MAHLWGEAEANHVLHYSFIVVIWLIDTSDMTLLYVWHDSWHTFGARQKQTMCDMTHL